MSDRFSIHWFTAEGIVSHRLTASGYLVALPAWPVAYDLLAETAEGFKKIQVRRATYARGQRKRQGWGDRASYWVGLQHNRSKGNGDIRLKKVRSTAKEFDYLAVVCEPTMVYMIPVSVLRSSSAEDICELIQNFRIKPPETAGTRADSIAAAERFEPYRNNFDIGGRMV